MIFSYELSKQSIKFLNKNQNYLQKDDLLKLLSLALERIYLNEDVNIDLKRLKNTDITTYRIRYRKIRIIFYVTEESVIVVSVIDIGFRGDIYR